MPPERVPNPLGGSFRRRAKAGVGPLINGRTPHGWASRVSMHADSRKSLLAGEGRSVCERRTARFGQYQPLPIARGPAQKRTWVIRLSVKRLGREPRWNISLAMQYAPDVDALDAHAASAADGGVQDVSRTGKHSSRCSRGTWRNRSELGEAKSARSSDSDSPRARNSRLGALERAQSSPARISRLAAATRASYPAQRTDAPAVRRPRSSRDVACWPRRGLRCACRRSRVRCR